MPGEIYGTERVEQLCIWHVSWLKDGLVVTRTRFSNEDGQVMQDGLLLKENNIDDDEKSMK